jgi:hypothetical protein
VRLAVETDCWKPKGCAWSDLAWPAVHDLEVRHAVAALPDVELLTQLCPEVKTLPRTILATGESAGRG